MERLLVDLRTALRSLRRSPGFVTAASAILAIGIGMAAAMYTVYTTVLVERLPVTAQDRIVVMHPLDQSGKHLDVPFTYLAEIARDSELVRGVAGVYHLGVTPLPFLDGTTPVTLNGVLASANYFDVLGMRQELGRFFVPADGDRGAPPVIVLSHAAWQRYFGGDPAIIGHVLLMPYTQQPAHIIGVAPAGFAYPAGTEAWTPLTVGDPGQVDMIARLAPNASRDAARQGLLALMQRINPLTSAADLSKLPPDIFHISGLEVRSLADTLLGSSRPTLVALTLAVALLLLIACVNVGNLMLVRFLGREREVAVRHAIGASRANVARLFLIESALIAALGGILGGALAIALLRVVISASPSQLPRVDMLGAVRTPFATATAVMIVATLLFGALPSVMASRVRSYALLRADVRTGGEGRSRRRARRWLVACQMALALVMLSGAALLARTVARLESIQLGYTREHLSVISLVGKQSDLPTKDRILAVGKQVVASLESTPGVIAATPIESKPFKGQSFFLMVLARAELSASERARAPVVPFEFVGPNYFRTFGIPIRAGRGLLPSDTKTGERVVVVNETLARQLWPGQEPIGRRLNDVVQNNTYTVVGVVSDTHFRDLRVTGPVAYFDWDQVIPFWSGLVAVRTAASLGSMLPSIRRAIRDADPNLVVFDTQTMDDLLDEPLSQPRLSALLLSGFSLVALLLSGIGLYGVMSSAVGQQTRDIGVRVALGAAPRDVYRLVMSEALWVIGAGAGIGLLGSAVGGRFLAAQLFDISSVDPLALGGASVLLLAIGMTAALLPARRATRVDPVCVLRAE